MLIEAAAEALSALREARAVMVSEDAISAQVITKAASDMAVARTYQRTSGDVTFNYDPKTGRLVSRSSATGVTTLKYDAIGRLIALERPLMDA